MQSLDVQGEKAEKTAGAAAVARVRPAQPRSALVAAGLGWVGGTALQLQQPELLARPIYVCFVLVVLVGWSLFAIKKIAIHDRPVFRACVLAGLAAALAFGLTGWRATAYLAGALDPALEGRDVAVVGMVSAMPERQEGGQRFRLTVESAQLDGAPVAVPRQLLLGWYGGVATSGADRAELQRQSVDLIAGDRWQMTVRLRAPHGTANPRGFDAELWFWEQGLQASGYVRAGPNDAPPQRLAQTWRHPVERARQAVRDAIFERLLAREPAAGAAGATGLVRVAGVLAALVVGDQGAIDRADWDVFRATGVAHLMSISGLHVTMFAWAAALVIGFLWRRSALLTPRLCHALPAPSAALIGGVALAAAYAVFSGWGVPAQRTVWMLATVALLRLSGRRWPWPAVWLLAGAVVLLIDPWALMQAGFWLSFVAVGVLFATDSGANNDRATGTRSRFRSLFTEQALITLALAPLSLLLFNQVSLVGLLANLLAIPWVTLVVTPLALAGVLWAPVWDAAGWALQALGWVLQPLAQLPFATVSIASAPLWAGTAAVLGGILLVLRLPWPLRALGLPLLLPVLLWQPLRPAAGEFELLAADIGQGNAVLVRTATHTLLYDAGPRYSTDSDAGHRILVPLLRALGERVDTLVVSHRDSDHAGGAAAVLAMQPQAQLLSSVALDHELQRQRPATRCSAGQRWAWDGITFEVLHPQPEDYAQPAKPNALSCVLRVSNGTRTALLTGDIEQPQEARLLAAGAPLATDVLLVPHHGSKTSSSAAFLDAARPGLALVQAGYRNRFGHPAAPVAERYRERGIPVVETARCGAARWSSTTPAEVACERQRAPHYWRHRVP